MTEENNKELHVISLWLLDVCTDDVVREMKAQLRNDSVMINMNGKERELYGKTVN